MSRIWAIATLSLDTISSFCTVAYKREHQAYKHFTLKVIEYKLRRLAITAIVFFNRITALGKGQMTY